MPVFGPIKETTQAAAHSGNLPFDFVARLADIVVKKSQEIPGSIETLLKELEQRVLSTGLRGALKSLVSRFQKSPADAALIAGSLPAITEAPRLGSQAAELRKQAEWLDLVVRIQSHGRTQTIENYTAFLISFDEPS